MNRFEKLLGGKKLAELRYLDGDIQVISQGDYVICAVTQQPILLQDLKYWCVDRQEAYASAEVALQAVLKARAGE